MSSQSSKVRNGRATRSQKASNDLITRCSGDEDISDYSYASSSEDESASTDHDFDPYQQFGAMSSSLSASRMENTRMKLSALPREVPGRAQRKDRAQVDANSTTSRRPTKPLMQTLRSGIFSTIISCSIVFLAITQIGRGVADLVCQTPDTAFLFRHCGILPSNNSVAHFERLEKIQSDMIEIQHLNTKNLQLPLSLVYSENIARELEIIVSKSELPSK